MREGLSERITTGGMPVLRLHYSADPEKRPGTEKGDHWLSQAVQGYAGGLNAPRWRKEMEIDYGAMMGTMAIAVLTWTANTEIDLAGYKVYRGLDNATPTFLVSVGKVTTYTDASLPSVNSAASYQLSAFDNAGNESIHQVTVTKVYDANPPAPPVGLTVVIN